MFIRVCGGRKKSEKFVSTKGTITITSNVTGASIKVLNGAEVITTATGSELDKTVITGKIPYGTYDVVISKDGYEPVTKNVTVNSDNVSVDATLTEVEKLEVSSISAVNATGEKTALNGATVSRSTSFEMKFNKAVDEETITNSTIKLVKGSETMAISLPTIDNGVIAFKSLSVLDADAEYKVVVDGIKSKDGKDTLTNTTIATFKSAKTVVTKKVIANGTTVYNASTNDGVTLNVGTSWNYATGDTSEIEVTFDTPVDKSTINSKSIQLIDVTTGKNIAVEGNQDNYTDKLRIQVVGAKDYLTPKHQYKLLLEGLKAANGMDIDTFSVTFAYQADGPVAVDKTEIYNGDLKEINKNTVDGLVNPLTTSKMLDNGKTFKAAASVIIDFGAAEIKLDENTVTTDYLYIREKDTHKKIAQTISYNKELNRVTLTPSERLKDDTDYEIFESPYIKNIYGVTLGTKDSEYRTAEFKTLDVTAPTVVGQPESTLEDKSLSKLPIDKMTKINIKMSEKIGQINPTGYAKGFATGNGNVLITRADDETKAAREGIIGAAVVTIGKDTYIQLTLNPSVIKNDNDYDDYIENNIKGKTYRVTLAGTNPIRTNDSEKVITDAYSINSAKNAMANDYSFTFTFEGDDKTAPKITDVKAFNGGDLTSLDGLTNVDLEKSVRIFFDCNDVDATTITNSISLVDKDNKEHPATSAKYETTGSTSYADVTFDKLTGALTLKAQNIADDSKLKTIGDDPFIGCTALTTITMKDNGTFYAKNNCLFEKNEDDSVKRLIYGFEVTLPADEGYEVAAVE
ncbi:MAG: PEGA domain-containing protein, partial [Lachnospiraceae bacterium]|nr:PEGA domain-containing protein [Lachnospiraceae bacterium]